MYDEFGPDFAKDRQFSADNALIVNFFNKPVLNKIKSLEEGRDVYNNEVFISIRTPGSKDIMHRKARHDDKLRFARQYEAFINNTEIPEDGTPIDLAGFLSPSQKETLKSMKIITVEQLAGIPDSSIHRIGNGGVRMVSLAKTFIDSNKSIGELSVLHEENEKLKRDNEMLKRQMMEISSRLDGLSEKPTVAFDVPVAKKAVENIDDFGDVFDPEIHATDGEGNPIITNSGHFRRKGGKK